MPNADTDLCCKEELQNCSNLNLSYRVMPLHEIVLLIGVCGFKDAAYALRLGTSHAHMHICFAAVR